MPDLPERGRALPSLAAAALIALVLSLGACDSEEQEQRPTPDPEAPNFVVVMTDDQSIASFTPELMPQTFAEIERPGTLIERGVAAPPLCCPARAGFLTGQYPHHHGVFSNAKGYLQLRDPESVLPAWLQQAGYATGFIGKPLNGYNRLGSTDAAPGFDTWIANFGGRAAYYDYELSVDGEVRSYGTDRADYMTDVLSGHALDFVSETSEGERPFFLWLAQYAPHRHAPPEDVAERIPSCATSVPTPPNQAAFRPFADAPLPGGPGYDEADVSDKQGEIALLPRINGKAEGFLEERWRCTLAAVKALDRTIGALVDRLRELGELDDTVIAYISDNGYFFGEHRLTSGKGWYYAEATQVPFAMRVPPELRGGRPAPPRIADMAANIDLAPTLLDYAGAEPCIADDECREPDGRSLRGLLAGKGNSFPRDRGILIELASGCEAYAAIRTASYLYAEPSDEASAKCELEPELYDLRSDPAELENLAGDPALGAIEDELAARLAALRECAGTSGPEACE